MTSVVLSVVLVLLTPIPWWAVGVVRHALGRRPAADPQLREQGQRFSIAGVAGLCVAAIAVSYLLNVLHLPHLPAGAGFVLLVVALLSIYAQPAWFLIRYYGRRLPGD